MYSKNIIEKSVFELERTSGLKLKRYQKEACREMAEALEPIYDGKVYLRELTPEEKRFIRNEQLMCSVDFLYWALRYARIKTKAPGPPKYYEPWSSQQLLHEIMSDLEETTNARKDGIMISNLKARQLGMCLKENTKILTTNMYWVEIKDVRVGDELISIDEGETDEELRIYKNKAASRRKSGILKKRGKSCKPERKLRSCIVEAKREVFDPVIKITMDNGEVIEATSDHRFLSKRNGYSAWVKVGKMRVGNEIRHITDPWSNEKTYEDGWMSGFMDGEGSLRGKKRAGGELCVYQVKGDVLDRAFDYLKSRGYSVRVDVDNRKGGESSKLGNQPVHKLVLGRMGEIFRLIGKAKPTRFLKKNWWVGKSLPGKRIGGGWKKIISIEHLPAQRMIDLQTSTKTFIANGFVSHNSTVFELVLSHKAFFTHGFNGLLAADEAKQSEYLFNMMERVYDHSPWWLKPKREYHVKGTQMYFNEMDSMILVQYGNLKADIGRGKTIHGAHLSELEKWEDTDQIDDGLMPALPRLPSTMCFMESTGEYRGSWWHSFFNDTLDGANRFTPFFVPWYAEPGTYTKPAPDGWEPDEITKAHERQVFRDSAKWMRGKTTILTKDQLYFWEFTRKEYMKKGNTGIFFCEYAATPQEAFRSANSSVFSWETLDYLRSKSSYPSAYEVLGPKIDSEKIRMEQLNTRKSRTRHV